MRLEKKKLTATPAKSTVEVETFLFILAKDQTIHTDKSAPANANKEIPDNPNIVKEIPK